jgi:hypothetical protein
MRISSGVNLITAFEPRRLQGWRRAAGKKDD